MFKTDLQIAQECNMEHILKVAEKAGIPEEYVDCYGKYKGKISSKYYDKIKDNPDAKLILPNISFSCFKSFAKQKIAMISEATVIWNASSLGTPFTLPPKPEITFLSCLSFRSTQRFHAILLGSMFSSLPC